MATLDRKNGTPYPRPTPARRLQEELMSAVRRITKNAILLNMARIISTLGKFFLFIFIARELGQETLGQFSFAIVFTSFFAIVISMGMDDLLVREVARDNRSSEKYVGNMFVMRMLLSLAIFIIIIILINILNYPLETRLAVYIFGGYVIFTSFSFLFRANFRAFEKMEWDALLEIIESLLTTAVGLLLIFTGFGLIALCLTFLISSILNAAIGLIINRRKFSRLKLKTDFQFWKDTIVKSAPFAVFALFILYPQVDTILLSSLKGAAVVGKYTAAYYIVTAFSPVVMNFMIALVPVISRYFISAKNMLAYVYEKSVKYLLLIAFPVSTVATILAEKIIVLLYGTGYGDSVLALKILAWNCVLLAMSRPMFYVLGAINRQGTCAVITISALTLSICLNILIIPYWSYLGSAVITLINGVLVTLASWYATSKYGFTLPLLKNILKPASASIVMGITVYAVDAVSGASLPVLILLGIIIYILFLIITRSINKDDLELIKAAFQKRKIFDKAQITRDDSGKKIQKTI